MCETGVIEQTLQMTTNLPSLQGLRRIRLGGTEGSEVSGSRLRFILFSGVLAANTHFSQRLSEFTNYRNYRVNKGLRNHSYF